MNEDLTRNLPQSFEERVLTELAAMRGELSTMNTRLDSLDTRLISLEEKVDARLRETRPIWEGVQQRLTEIEKELATLNRQFRTLIRDSFDLRSRVEKLEDSQPSV